MKTPRPPSFHRSVSWSSVLILIALSMGVIAGDADRDRPVEPETAPQPTSRKTTRDFEGLIEPSRVVELSSAVDGLLETVTVERGDVVEKGQIVATLESSVERATLEISRMRSELEGEVRKQKARVEHTRTKFEHDRDLQAKGYLAGEKLDLSRTNMLLAQAELQQAEEALRLADLERDRAEAALELRTIRSPVDGVVVERHLSPGELVTRQLQSRILTIARVSPLRVQVILPVSMFGKIETGDLAEIRIPKPEERSTSARVKSIDRVVDPASDTFRIRLELGAEEGWTAGLRCRVRFLD